MSEALFTTALFELDSLLDTRMAVLFNIDPKLAEEALNGDYLTRKTDSFGRLTVEEFKEHYDKRNKLALKTAIKTPIVKLMYEFAFGVLNNSINSPYQTDAKIKVNIYPYDLTASERETLVKTFSFLTDYKAIIEIVSLSPKEITPKMVKEELELLVMYDYTTWLDIHSEHEDLKKYRDPEATLLAPALYFREPPDAATLKKLKEENITPFSAIELAAGPYIGLKLLSIESFSLHLGNKPTA